LLFSRRATAGEQEVIDFCQGKLARYKIPKSVVFVDKPLPRTAAGKVLKRELRVEYGVAALKVGSVACAKRLLQQAAGDLAARLETERAAFGQQVVSDEARAGIAAFVGRQRVPG
jgi:hypothetical protein